MATNQSMSFAWPDTNGAPDEANQCQSYCQERAAPSGSRSDRKMFMQMEKGTLTSFDIQHMNTWRCAWSLEDNMFQWFNGIAIADIRKIDIISSRNLVKPFSLTKTSKQCATGLHYSTHIRVADLQNKTARLRAFFTSWRFFIVRILG